ncbi:PD-(D/E)XK nuclease family protein [Bradyrhizobium sp. USDA 4508]
MLSSVKVLARELYERQLNFALEHPINDPNLRVGEEGDDFCLLYTMEYGPRPSDGELDHAWDEIEQALVNLYEMDAIRTALKTSSFVAAQRPLNVPLIDGVTASARPDVIAFQRGAPPIIIDWKVHALAENDAWLQLATYAIVLSRCKHKDFPEDFECRPEHIRLLEVQLLTGLVREHALDIDLIEEAEDYAVESAYEMHCLVDERKSVDVEIEDFLPASSAETCQACQFRSLCWEKVNAH